MTGYSEYFSPFRWSDGVHRVRDPAMDNGLLVDGDGEDARSWYSSGFP